MDLEMRIGITGYFAFALVLALSLLSYSSSEADIHSSSSSNIYLNTISSSSSIDKNTYSSSHSLSDHADEVARRRSLAENILLLLGTPADVASVDPQTADGIRSCFKYFVSPNSRDKLKKFIWSAPTRVKELAKEAVNYEGDPRNFLHSYLNAEMQAIADADGTVANGQKIESCRLTMPQGQSFQNKIYNMFFEKLYEYIAENAGASVGSTVKLDRYDLFHGHLFLVPGTRRMGIIFHAQEYPIRSASFDVTIDLCQNGFNWMEYNQTNMNLRNILWLAPLVGNTGEVLAPGVLVALDTRPGGIIYEDLVVNEVQYQKKAQSILPGDFGADSGVVNYLNVKANPNDEDNYKLYVCATVWNNIAGVTSQ